MEVYVSINGVLRNLIQKFDFHYQDHFLDTDVIIDIDEAQQENPPFEYKINYPIQNDNLLNHYLFESKEEYEYFLYIEFPLEIFGYAGVSYPTAISDLNKLIYSHYETNESFSSSGSAGSYGFSETKNINFTVIGLDELGKSKSSTLFFLSKNGFLGNNIKFILSKDIDNEWKKCDMWITDNKDIIDRCPTDKKVIKFNTEYNQYFTHNIEINNLSKIDL
jgi:hypothetical protein